MHYHRSIYISSIAAIVALAACSSSDNTGDAVSTIDWTACDDSPELDCASIEVPLDYNDETGEMINIGLRRLEADNNESARLLLLNPGGPGASGITLLNDLFTEDFLPERIRSNFHVVGFDPRGVGESGPVDCSEFGILEEFAYTTTRDDIESLVARSTDIANSCFEKYGEYLQHLGTNNAARDMDEIRKAAAMDSLDFLGYSYGTRLGAVYLQNFPQTSGAFVLDGVLPPSSAAGPLSAGTVVAMQRNLDQLLDGCTAVDEQCDVTVLKQQLQERVDYFVQAIDSETLPIEFDTFEALENEAIQLLQVLLVVGSEAGLADFALSPLIAYLQSNDSQFLAQFLQVLDSLEPDTENQEEEEEEEDGRPSDTATVAIQCADDAERPTVDMLYSLLQDMNISSDIYAETGIQLASICAGWPDALSPVEPIATNTAPQALLIGGSTDAQTPIEWLAEMSMAIGGIAITSSHFGHTVALSEGNSCVDDQVVEFLLNQTTPLNLEC